MGQVWLWVLILAIPLQLPCVGGLKTRMLWLLGELSSLRMQLVFVLEHICGLNAFFVRTAARASGVGWGLGCCLSIVYYSLQSYRSFGFWGRTPPRAGSVRRLF